MKKVSTNTPQKSKTKRLGKQPRKDKKLTEIKVWNTGKWTESEKQEFSRMFALYKENKITRSRLFLSIKTRSRKQANSHLNKIKYYIDKKFKNSETLSNKSKFMEKLQLSSKPIQRNKENSIQFEDDITNKGMEMSVSLLEKIVCIQKFSREKSGTIKLPMKIDESILRTIAEEKLFYNMIHKRVQEDKQCRINKAKISDNWQSLKQSTKHTNLLDATTRPNESSDVKKKRTGCCNTSTAYQKDYLHMGLTGEDRSKEYSARKTPDLNNDEWQRNYSNFSFKSFSKVLIDNIIRSRENVIDKKKSFNEQISEFFID